jgi:phage shock protein E
MGLLSFFGFGNNKQKIKEFLEKGAVIIDVRTKEEFIGGHISGSKNIPLNLISSKIESLKKENKSIIACCRTGRRSGLASSILKNNGIDVINGGGWMSLNSKISSF